VIDACYDSTILSSTGVTASTTRTLSTRAARRFTGELLAPGQLVRSPETGFRCEVVRLLGQGGFGQVYLVQRLGRSSVVPEVFCIKASPRIDGWLREAYFGQMLHGSAKVIRIFDAFPLGFGEGADAPMLYCLAMELARHGDLSSYLARTGKGWSEPTTRREIAGVLEVLGRLHRGQMLHRDLTPLNVFVSERGRLKLGDFGIARPQSDRRGVTTRTMNALTAPTEFLAGAVPKWQARDDVYQVGQLLAMLIKGDARARMSTKGVRLLACSDALKEIIYRCIGERRKRYESALELIEALRTRPPNLRAGRVSTLAGKHVAFTGILSKPRSEAMRAARRAGAIVHGRPSALTSVVVRGKPNPLQAAGREGGLKLMEIKRLRERGQRITLLDEARFWRLVEGSTKRPRSTAPRRAPRRKER
jgi:serine/threonine-protein kinase